MHPKKPLAPLLPRTANAAIPAKRILLLIDLPVTVRCQQFGNLVESAGPITAHLISKLLPDVVAIPLISNHSDAIEDLEVLSDLGFYGRCIVFADQLPNRHLVVKELRRHAPGLRVSLLTVPR